MTELFGLAAVIAMVTTYALEARSAWFVLAFALSCAAASLYAVLIQSLPFALAEGIWAVIAFLRWRRICNARSSDDHHELK
jgi:hypothetical protein